MLNWLIEDLYLIAILLGIGTVLLGGAWLRDLKRKYLLAASVLGLLAITAFVLWYYLNADKRELKRKVEEMAAGIPHDLDRVFSHISITFRHGFQDKRSLRQKAEEMIRQRNVTEVRVIHVQVENVDRAARKAEVSFNFKIQGNWGTGIEFFHCRATFVLDEDGEWRMSGFQVYYPTNVKDPIAIPGF